MKRYLSVLLLLFTCYAEADMLAAVVVVMPVVSEQAAANEGTAPSLAPTQLSRKAVEQKLGRKLTFKERIGLSIVRGKMKRAQKKAERRAKKGKATSPPMGRDWTPIAALVCLVLSLFFFPFLLPAIILSIIGKKRNRDIDPSRYKMANIVFIISLILFGLLILLILLLIALFASFAG